MRKKLKSRSGLSMVEMLAAVFILALLALVLHTGLQAAMESYHGSVAASETQLLLSTLSDALSDDLRYARQVELGPDGTLRSYHSDSYGEGTTLTLGGDGQVYAHGMRLLPPGAYRNGLYLVERMAVTYQDGCFTIDLKVREAKGSIHAETQLTIRCLNEVTP